MSVPGTESGQDAERAATATPPKADQWNDPRLPWRGKPRAADILCWAGIVLSGVYYWALLPLRVSLLGTHPVVAELLNGSTESIISAAAFARTGNGTLAVVLLAAIPGLMKFDALYWWAGRLWGERFIMALPGSRRAARHMARAGRAGRKFTWPAVLASSFLPVPRAIIYVIAGWAGMRLVTFLVLDLIGALLWAGLLAGLGYALGHDAVVAAKTISHYSWWVTIGIVALSLLFALRSRRRPTAGAAPRPARPTDDLREAAPGGPGAWMGYMTTEQEAPRVVSASREIAAGAGRIFDLIAEPAQQPRWDGNNNLVEAPAGQRVRRAGDVFTMSLTRGGIRENHVVEFDEGRRIAWMPAEPGRQPPGHLWRWELEPAGESRTRVTHTYDWTRLTDEKRLPRARATTADKLQASLDRLAALAEGS